MNGSTPAPSTAIVTAQSANLGPDMIVAQGAGKSYQSVAQSMAIAVQDATDGLRNTTTMATTAMGVALAQFLATKNDEYLKAIAPAQGMITAATTNLTTVGSATTAILRAFPAGSS